MSIEKLMAAVKDELRSVPYLYGTPVIVEDLGDISNGIEVYFGKSTRCVRQQQTLISKRQQSFVIRWLNSKSSWMT